MIRLLAQNAQSLAGVRGHAMTADVLGRLSKGLDMSDAMHIFSASKGPYFLSVSPPSLYLSALQFSSLSYLGVSEESFGTF